MSNSHQIPSGQLCENITIDNGHHLKKPGAETARAWADDFARMFWLCLAEMTSAQTPTVRHRTDPPQFLGVALIRPILALLPQVYYSISSYCVRDPSKSVVDVQFG